MFGYHLKAGGATIFPVELYVMLESFYHVYLFLFLSKYGFNVIAIKKGEEVIVNINPEEILDKNIILVVIGNTVKLSKF